MKILKNKYTEVFNVKNFIDSNINEEVTYETHDNGGRVYKVTIKNNNTNYLVSVVCIENDNLYNFTAERVFIGTSPFNQMTEFSEGYGSDFDGNSILINTYDNNYIFIGHICYQFVSLCPIKYFVSPVGNNDVPYPYFIDIDDNVYMYYNDKIHVIKQYPYKLLNIVCDINCCPIEYIFFKKPKKVEFIKVNMIDNN